MIPASALVRARMHHFTKPLLPAMPGWFLSFDSSVIFAPAEFSVFWSSRLIEAPARPVKCSCAEQDVDSGLLGAQANTRHRLARVAINVWSDRALAPNSQLFRAHRRPAIVPPKSTEKTFDMACPHGCRTARRHREARRWRYTTAENRHRGRHHVQDDTAMASVSCRPS